MADRMDALEVRMVALEETVPQSLAEFRQFLMAEFAKLKDCRSPNKTLGKFVLKIPDPEPMKVKSCEKLKEGDNETDSWSQKTLVNVVPTSEPSNPKLHVASLEIPVAESVEQENEDDDLDGVVAECDEESKDGDIGPNVKTGFGSQANPGPLKSNFGSGSSGPTGGAQTKGVLPVAKSHPNLAKANRDELSPPLLKEEERVRTMQKVRRWDKPSPPPEPPSSDLHTSALPEPKPPDTDQSAAVFPNQNHYLQLPVPSPVPPDLPDFDPFLAVTKDLEEVSEIEIEEEKKIKGSGSENLNGSKPRRHESWVSRDPIGSNYPARPGLLGSGSLGENRPRPKPTVFGFQGSNSKGAVSSFVSSNSRPGMKGGGRNRGLQHLPYRELMERRAKGLCFRCGEKFHLRHQCAERQWRLLILGDDEDVNAGEVLAIEADDKEEEERSLDLFGAFGLNNVAFVLDLSGLDMTLGISGMYSFSPPFTIDELCKFVVASKEVPFQQLPSSSIYVWFLLHKHMTNSLSSSCNNPKQNSLANEKIGCLHYAVLIRQWDPGKSHIPMIVAAYEHCWSSISTFHGLLHFVFDRGKIWEIQMELLPNLSFLNKLIPIWVSSKLMSLPDARKAIETTSNLEDKVVSQGGGSDRTLGPCDPKRPIMWEGYSRREDGELVSEVAADAM